MEPVPASDDNSAQPKTSSSMVAGSVPPEHGAHGDRPEQQQEVLRLPPKVRTQAKPTERRDNNGSSYRFDGPRHPPPPPPPPQHMGLCPPDSPSTVLRTHSHFSGHSDGSFGSDACMPHGMPPMHMAPQMQYSPRYVMAYPMAYPAEPCVMGPPSPLMGSPVGTPTAMMFPQTPFAQHSPNFPPGVNGGGFPEQASPSGPTAFGFFHPIFNSFPAFIPSNGNGMGHMGPMHSRLHPTRSGDFNGRPHQPSLLNPRASRTNSNAASAVTATAAEGGQQIGGATRGGSNGALSGGHARSNSDSSSMSAATSGKEPLQHGGSTSAPLPVLPPVSVGAKPAGGGAATATKHQQLQGGDANSGTSMGNSHANGTHVSMNNKRPPALQTMLLEQALHSYHAASSLPSPGLPPHLQAQYLQGVHHGAQLAYPMVPQPQYGHYGSGLHGLPQMAAAAAAAMVPQDPYHQLLELAQLEAMNMNGGLLGPMGHMPLAAHMQAGLHMPQHLLQPQVHQQMAPQHHALHHNGHIVRSNSAGAATASAMLAMAGHPQSSGGPVGPLQQGMSLNGGFPKAPRSNNTTQQLKFNPDGQPRLNARQRRTLRRAKERAIKGLLEAGHHLLQQAQGSFDSNDPDSSDGSDQEDSTEDISSSVPNSNGSSLGGASNVSTTCEAAVPSAVLEPAVSLSDAAAPAAAGECFAPDAAPAAASPATAVAPSVDTGASAQADADAIESSLSSSLLTPEQRAKVATLAAGNLGANGALPTELEALDISQLIQQLSLKKDGGVVDDKLIRDLQIIQNLLGALKVSNSAAPAPRKAGLPHTQVNNHYHVSRPKSNVGLVH